MAPTELQHEDAAERTVGVRPLGPNVWFIQLDDLKPEQLQRIAPRISRVLDSRKTAAEVGKAFN